MDTRALSENFLMAAQQLADAMLAEIQTQRPHDAEKIANAVGEGAHVSLAFTFGREHAAVELLLRVRGEAIALAEVPMQSGPSVTKLLA